MNKISEKLKNSTVAIAGLGGLGSVVAAALARANIGRLIIADFDIIDKSNLNRQHYFVDQIGQPKVAAMRENLKRINPAVEITSYDLKLTADNITDIFADATIIAECFDKSDQKQMLVETVLVKMSCPVVSVSGLAGYGNSNTIKTRVISERLILVGDGQSGIDTNSFLSAARVGIAACHQANAILELLIDAIKEPV